MTPLVRRSHAAGWLPRALLLLAALAPMNACTSPSTLPTGDPSDPAAGPELESEDPMALSWVQPLAADTVGMGDPVDLVVATQHPDAVVVHFEVDGQEVGVCDAGAADEDCHDDDLWDVATTFASAGPHTVRAWFATASGAVVDATTRLDVVAADADQAPTDPSADPSEPDPVADDMLVTEGSGEIVQDIVGARGYLDPSTSFHSACGGTPWQTRGGRVLLQHGRIDGSVDRVERCWQRYQRSFLAYSDLDYVSRASLMAAAIAAGNCGCDTTSWSHPIVSGSICHAITGMDATTCARGMATTPDLALEVAARYLALPHSVRRHHNDPPRIAALLGAHAVACSRRDAWHLRAPAHYINHFVAAYNAYRTAEHMGLLAAPPRPSWAPARGQVATWITTADGAHRLERLPDVALGADFGGTANTTVIQVDGSQQYQSMEGFGGAMTDSSAWLIWTQLSPAERDRVMAGLFDPANGIGMSFLRLPIGASDFVHTAPASHLLASGQNRSDDGPLYSYANQRGPAGDLLAHFHDGIMAHDGTYIVSSLQRARQLNPSLRILASPWTPPRWMKTNDAWDNEANSSHLCGSPSAPNGACGGFDARPVWADYLVRFLETYGSAPFNVPIDLITPQNEPGQQTGGYGGMNVTPDDEVDFVEHYLGPAIDRATAAGRLGRVPRILAWDWNASEPNPATILGHDRSNQYVSGVAFHCYGGLSNTTAASDFVHRNYGCEDLHMTECTRPPMSRPSQVMDVVINMPRHWSRSVLLWNLALDPNGGPGVGSGCFHSGTPECGGMVTVDPARHTATWNQQYYELGQASRFVLRGARRVDTGPDNSTVENVAFRNPDGSVVLVVFNNTSSDQVVDVQWDGTSVVAGYTLHGSDVATFVWQGG